MNVSRYPGWGVAFAAILFMSACASDTIDGKRLDNQAPTVWLAAAPPEGSTGTYTVSLYWGGWDPDGEIANYEYLITDNITGVFSPSDTVGAPWYPVVGNDSTFTFSADSLVDANPQGQTVTFVRSHTFFIRAKDTEGLRSREPAHRSFTSRTISPEVWIKVPVANLGLTAAELPPISTIQWTATDYIDDLIAKQEPESVQWALVSTSNHSNSFAQTVTYLQNTPNAPEWTRWRWYRAPGDSGKSWTTPPLDFGDYVFAVRAKDEAGAVTAVLNEPVVPGTAYNVRRLRVTPNKSGPTLMVTSPIVGSVITTSCNYPLTIADIPARVPLSFTLKACAEQYGGTISGYRYGWDVLDPNDPDQWEIDYTPFIGQSPATTPPREYSFGTHTFTAEVIDNSGYCSRIEVKINIIRFGGQRNLLIVDDYKPDENVGQSGWIPTNGGEPDDAQHDGFWLDMVSNLESFDPTVDMVSVTVDKALPLTTIAGYKNIIWSVASDIGQPANETPLLYQYILFRSKRPPADATGGCNTGGGLQGKVVPNYLGLAMQAGVHVLIAGAQPVQLAATRVAGASLRWPAIPLYEFDPSNSQVGPGPDEADLINPSADHAFAYRDLCLEVVDYGILTASSARLTGTGTNRRYCGVTGWRSPNSASLREDGMRGAIAADPNFRNAALRFDVSGPGRRYAPESRSYAVEVYNPAYFRQGAACQWVPSPRPCFEPIYLLDCIDTAERTYMQPIAFWTSTFANAVLDDVVGAVAARSAVFGFPPVFCTPADIKPGIEYILYDEWQLPRRPINMTSNDASQ